MKKAIFILMLFLTFSFVLSAQMRITRTAVGTGGFITKQQDGEKIRAAGLFGMPMTGAHDVTLKGTPHKIYLGFWTGIRKDLSINERFSLDRGIHNTPNPVTDYTNFIFALNEPSFVTINIYNISGSLIAQVINNQLLNDGEQSVQWSVSTLPNYDNYANTATYWYEMVAVPAYSNRSNNVTVFTNALVITK